jgi:hypothetical protein
MLHCLIQVITNLQPLTTKRLLTANNTIQLLIETKVKRNLIKSQPANNVFS